MRRLLLALLVVALLLLGLDRGAAWLASRQLAARVQTSQGLPQRPSVVIGGFPFLTQVVGGRYDDVRLSAASVTRDGLRFDDVQVRASGVRVALGDALGGRLRAVPVEHGTASARLTFQAVQDLVRRYAGAAASLVTLSSPQPGRLRVTGSVSALGLSQSVSADADLAVTAGRLQVLPLPQSLSLVPSPLRDDARRLLTLDVPLPPLPFGVRLTGGRVQGDGVLLLASADGVAFPVR